MDVVDFARYLYNKFEEREKDIAQDLVLGNIKDWNQYQHLVGEARGLSLAKEEIKSPLENNVEDAEQIITSTFIKSQKKNPTSP